MGYSRDFFEALGYLVYALSKADGKISVEEEQALVNSLLENFGSWATDTKGLRARAAYEIAVEQNLSVDEALQKAKEHFSYVPFDVRKHRLKIIDTIENIAFADRVLTENEAEILKKIKKLLNEFVEQK